MDIAHYLTNREPYTDKLMDEARIDARIRELAYILDHAHPPKPRAGGVAQVGNIIGVATSSGPWQFTLVDPSEAKPDANLIPIDSPLGKATLGRHIGEVIRVSTPGGGLRAFVVAYIK